MAMNDPDDGPGPLPRQQQAIITGASVSQANAYHSINLIILTLGLYVCLKVVKQWHKVLFKASPVIRSYVYITMADLVVLTTYLPLTIQGLAGGIGGSITSATIHDEQIHGAALL